MSVLLDFPDGKNDEPCESYGAVTVEVTVFNKEEAACIRLQDRWEDWSLKLSPWPVPRLLLRNFKLHYHNSETTIFGAYPYYGNLI